MATLIDRRTLEVLIESGDLDQELLKTYHPGEKYTEDELYDLVALCSCKVDCLYAEQIIRSNTQIDADVFDDLLRGVSFLYRSFDF